MVIRDVWFSQVSLTFKGSNSPDFHWVSFPSWTLCLQQVLFLNNNHVICNHIVLFLSEVTWVMFKFWLMPSNLSPMAYCTVMSNSITVFGFCRLLYCAEFHIRMVGILLWTIFCALSGMGIYLKLSVIHFVPFYSLSDKSITNHVNYLEKNEVQYPETVNPKSKRQRQNQQQHPNR